MQAVLVRAFEDEATVGVGDRGPRSTHAVRWQIEREGRLERAREPHVHRCQRHRLLVDDAPAQRGRRRHRDVADGRLPVTMEPQLWRARSAYADPGLFLHHRRQCCRRQHEATQTIGDDLDPCRPELAVLAGPQLDHVLGERLRSLHQPAARLLLAGQHPLAREIVGRRGRRVRYRGWNVPHLVRLAGGEGSTTGRRHVGPRIVTDDPRQRLVDAIHPPEQEHGRDSDGGDASPLR